MIESETAAATEDLISFEVGEATPLPLYGVIHRPAVPQAPVGIVLLGGWSGTRVGPHGILVAMARELAAAGFCALRFDFRGRGDSGGEQRLAHIGTMVEDACAAARYLQEQGGVRSIVLIGICAGAQVALAAAPGLPDLFALALWSPPPLHPDPVSTDSAAAPARPARSRRRLISLLKVYCARLFDSRTWVKLLHGQLQPRMILQVLRGGGRKQGSGTARTAAADWAGPKPDERQYETALPEIAAPALFIYGGADPEREESTRYYTRVGSREARVYVVEGANHAFYSLAWKREVIRETLNWLQDRCSRSST